MRYTFLLIVYVLSFYYSNVNTQRVSTDKVVFPDGKTRAKQRPRQPSSPQTPRMPIVPNAPQSPNLPNAAQFVEFSDPSYSASAAAGFLGVSAIANAGLGGAFASTWTDFSGSNAVTSATTNNNFIQDYNNNYHSFNMNPFFRPHRPKMNRYRDFQRVFDDIDRKAEKNYDKKLEGNEIMDDLNGRSIVAPGQYPHMAAIGFRNNDGRLEFQCGGSLISDSFVLTAAHCCYVSGLTPEVIKFGDIFLKEREPDVQPQRRRVADIYVHPYYNSSLYYNDIALIQLNRPIDYSHFVRPIRLWTSHQIPYEKVHTMGYGSTKFAQAKTNILTELEKSIVPMDKCREEYPADEEAPQSIIESQICAQDFEKMRDTCQGDSGGPLQLNLERRRRRRRYRYYLVGITSYGAVCGGSKPGVYTRVSSYIDWIASIVWPDYFGSEFSV